MNPPEEPKNGKNKDFDADSTLAAFPAINFSRAAGSSCNYAPVLITLIGEATPTRMIVEAPELIIGRSKDADISLQDETTSRQHAKVVYTNCGASDQKPQLLLYDLKSRNGVFVNGVKVNGHIPLRDNARINIGDIQMGLFIIEIPKRGEEVDEDAEPAPVSDDSPTREIAPPSALAGESASGAPVMSSAPGSSSHIAVIDSDFEAATDLRQRLQATGRYTAVIFRRLDHALKNFESHPPRMILLDADLEGPGSCIDMCVRLKNDDQFKGIPIIVLYKKFDSDLVRNSLKAGAQSYLVKPIENLTQLTNRIDIHMNINRMMPSLGS